MQSKAMEFCSGIAKGGKTDGRKQNFSTDPQKISFFSWFSPLDAASHTVHQLSGSNRSYGSTYCTYKLTLKIRGKNPMIMSQKVVKTLLEWCSISLMLQIKVKYRHFILVSPDCFNYHSSHQCKTSLHSGTFPSFTLCFLILRDINSDVEKSIMSILKDSMKQLNPVCPSYLQVQRNGCLGRNHRNFIRRRFYRDLCSLMLRKGCYLIGNSACDKRDMVWHFHVIHLALHIWVKWAAWTEIRSVPTKCLEDVAETICQKVCL